MPKHRVFVAARAEVVRSNRSRSGVIDRPEVRVRAVEGADVPYLTLRGPDHGVLGATRCRPNESPVVPRGEVDRANDDASIVDSPRETRRAPGKSAQVDHARPLSP